MQKVLDPLHAKLKMNFYSKVRISFASYSFSVMVFISSYLENVKMPTKKSPHNVTFIGLFTNTGFYVTFWVRDKMWLVSISPVLRATLFTAFHLLIPDSFVFLGSESHNHQDTGSCRDPENTASRSQSNMTFQDTELCHVQAQGLLWNALHPSSWYPSWHQTRTENTGKKHFNQNPTKV